MTLDKQKMIRLSGILGIIGAVLCAVSDLLFEGMPVSGKEVTFENMALLIPYGRTIAGALLGVLVIPLWLFILVPMYYALKPAGKWFVIPVILLFAHYIAVATAYHGSYALYTAGYYALANVGGESKTILLEMIEKFMAFKTGLFYTVAITNFLGSIWFIITVLFRPTLYKRWMVIFTPLLTMQLRILCKQLPAPIGGYILPPTGSILFAVFFLITTLVSWNYNGEAKNEFNAGI